MTGFKAILWKEELHGEGERDRERVQKVVYREGPLKGIFCNEDPLQLPSE